MFIPEIQDNNCFNVSRTRIFNGCIPVFLDFLGCCKQTLGSGNQIIFLSSLSYKSKYFCHLKLDIALIKILTDNCCQRLV